MEDLQHPAGWASGQPDPRLVPGPRAGLDARLSHTVAESPGHCSEELTFLLSGFRCVRSLVPGAEGILRVLVPELGGLVCTQLCLSVSQSLKWANVLLPGEMLTRRNPLNTGTQAGPASAPPTGAAVVLPVGTPCWAPRLLL